MKLINAPLTNINSARDFFPSDDGHGLEISSVISDVYLLKTMK